MIDMTNETGIYSEAEKVIIRYKEEGIPISLQAKLLGAILEPDEEDGETWYNLFGWLTNRHNG